jgi:oligopeptide transport system substrate-binding protein
MFKKLTLLLAAAAAFTMPAAQALAVVVPPGVKLAKEQVLHRGNGSEPGTLDPHRSEGVPASHILRDLYEGLTSEAVDGAIVPGAAKSWDISADGKVYTFHLREDAKWSNGDPVVAEDFVAGMRRSVDPATGSAYSQILAPILNAKEVIAGSKPPDTLGVEAVDDHTLVIRLVGPTPYLLGLLNHSASYPIHRPSLAKYGEQFSRPGKLVGNGAFVLTEWVVNGHLTVERNPHYWDNAHTVLDKVIYYPIEDQSTDLKRYRAGEIDWTYEIPNSQFRWLKEHLEKELYVTPQLATYYYTFNVTRPPFKDNPKLRRALSMVINREILATKVAGVGEVPAYSFVPPGVNNYTPPQLDYKDMTMAERIAEAKRLYNEAGYSESNPFEVELRYNTSENHKKIAIAVAAMWKQALGVKTRLLNEEWKVFLENRKTRAVTQVVRDGWVGDYNDAFTFIELMQCDHGLNYSGYCNPEYDKLVKAASVEPDMAKRRGIMEKAEAMLLRDHPFFPIYFYVTKRLVKPYVGNYQNNIMDHPYSKHHYIIAH